MSDQRWKSLVILLQTIGSLIIRLLSKSGIKDESEEQWKEACDLAMSAK